LPTTSGMNSGAKAFAPTASDSAAPATKPTY
jgi:hypothetical protein